MAAKNKTESAWIPKELFCDASFLIAFFAPGDRDHNKTRKVSHRLMEHKVRLYTTWPTTSEAATILLYHYGYSNSVALLNSLSAFSFIIPGEEDYYQASALFKEFNRDQKLSFNDLLTYTLIRWRLGNIPIVTFDKDFATLGLTVYPAHLF